MLTTFGDLAQGFQSQRQNATLKSTSARLATELTTGRSADVGKHLAGDFGALAGVSLWLSVLDAFATANAEAGRFAATVQTAVDRIRSLGGDAAPNLLQAGSSGAASFVDTAGVAARDALDAALSALNTRDGGRSVFAGVATSTPAVADAATILAALAPVVAAETSAAGVIRAVDDFFAAPTGGYGDIGYLGAAVPLDPFRVAQDDAVPLGVTANDPALRDMLKALVTGALLAEGALVGDPRARADLARTAGERLLTADSKVAGLQGRIGIAEARIDAAATRNAAERAGLETTRADIVGVDGYEAATALQQTQSQLEVLFAVTARLSTLKLSDFL
ncbi:flagellar hook-associated protein 3 FlgL [Rhodobacteraceae bacterium MBR-64]